MLRLAARRPALTPRSTQPRRAVYESKDRVRKRSRSGCRSERDRVQLGASGFNGGSDLPRRDMPVLAHGRQIPVFETLAT